MKGSWIMFVGCGLVASRCVAPDPEIATGAWSGSLRLVDDAALPFAFELEPGGDGRLRSTVRNGDERIVHERLTISGRALVWPLDPYDSRIEATLSDDGHALEGTWFKRRPTGIAEVPFAARQDDGARLERPSEVVEGRWRAMFDATIEKLLTGG